MALPVTCRRFVTDLVGVLVGDSYFIFWVDNALPGAGRVALIAFPPVDFSGAIVLTL